MDESFWDEVERSKRMTPQQRFLETLHLNNFKRVLNIIAIRQEFPDADDAQVREILIQRNEFSRQQDDLPMRAI